MLRTLLLKEARKYHCHDGKRKSIRGIVFSLLYVSNTPSALYRSLTALSQRKIRLHFQPDAARPATRRRLLLPLFDQRLATSMKVV